MTVAAQIRRLAGIVDDATAGGTTADNLAGAAVPDCSIFWPVSSGNIEPTLTRIDRSNEVRGRRAVSPPLPFRAEPHVTLAGPAYRSIVEKLLKKTLGGTDSVSGGAATGYTHTIAELGFGNVQLPAFHTQILRDDLNHKAAGTAAESLSLAFPLDGEGTFSFDGWALFYDRYRSTPPTPTYSDVSDILLLRDATVYIDGTGLALATPAAPTLTPSGTGGTLAAATNYNYRIIAYNSNGQTVAGPEAAGAATTTGATSSITVAWTAVPNAIGYIVAGRTTGAELILTDVGNVVSYVDTGVATPSGALPTVNATIGAIPDLIEFSFSYKNNIMPHWYAGRNIVTKVLGTGSLTRKLWFPSENKLGAAQDVTYAMTFGNTNIAQDIARDYEQIQKIVFNVVGGPTPGATNVNDSIQITIYNAAHNSSGGPSGLAPRGDATYTVDGGGFYSDTNAADVQVQVINSISTPLV